MEMLEATPRLELKAVSPISSAPKAHVSAPVGDQRPQKLPGHHLAAQNKSHWVRRFLPVLKSDCPFGGSPFQGTPPLSSVSIL